MATTGNKLRAIAAGIDQRWKTSAGVAEEIVNARIDPNGLGWLFDRGLEPWWHPGSSFSITGGATTITKYAGSRIDSCYIWSKQNTEQVYYLVEQGGDLFYFWGNKNGGSYLSDMVVLDTNRHRPSVNEPGTQYIPFGNRLLILNGYDAPIWFYGRSAVRSFGFTFPTASPLALDIQTSYLSGAGLETGIASPHFTDTSHYGLGEKDARNHYTWKCTFITDTGSESPLSAPTYVDWFPGTDSSEDARFGVFLSDLPIGPEGTVARRIYRTKNQKLSTSSGAADAVYYFCKQINENTSRNFIDIVPDGSLVDLAPSQLDSVAISSAYQYGAAWNGSIWLAGGAPHPTRIIYSRAGAPEQFPGANYFELGNTVGGAITQIYPYYNNLLVFRQRAIDMIRITSQGYTVSQLSPEIGTEASNTIKLVPNAGICFLGRDGVYAITGGTEGGSSIRIEKISNQVAKEFERLNIAAIQRAVAVYSAKEKEYWVHYPADGQNFNTRGAVLHTANGAWSLRHSTTSDDSLFRFSAMSVDPDGNIIIGTIPEWLEFDGTPGSPITQFSTCALPPVLHVWCGSNRWGMSWSVSSYSNDVATYAPDDNSKPGALWESAWIDFGDNSLKYRVFSVEVEILSQGNTSIELEWAKDYDYAFTSAGQQKQNRPETVGGTSEDPVLGPLSSAATNFFKVQSSKLQDGRVTRLRWDVNTGLTNNFKFRLNSVNEAPFHLVSFTIDFNNADIKALNQLARSNPGQPR